MANGISAEVIAARIFEIKGKIEPGGEKKHRPFSRRFYVFAYPQGDYELITNCDKFQD